MAYAITRVVKLTLQPQHVEAFRRVFIDHQQQISRFEGCSALQAFQDNHDPQVFFTISQWDSEAHLYNYRFSEFFRQLWSTVKPMFAAKAVAHSMTAIS